MGKLNRLLGMAAKALDLDGTGNRASTSGDPHPPRTSQPYTPPSPRDRYTPPAPHAGSVPPSTGARRGTDADRAAIARYDYLLQTADPHRVEQIHREAFARLTPEQRAQVQQQMTAELAPGECPASSSPDDLARAAGRTEAARPGRMRGLLSRVGGFGTAGVVGGAAVGALGVVAVGAIGSAVAAPLLEQAAGLGVDFDALAQGIDLEAIAGGLGAEELAGAAEGVLGSAGDSVSGLGDTVSGLGDTAGEWGQKLGDLGIPGIGDLLGR